MSRKQLITAHLVLFLFTRHCIKLLLYINILSTINYNVGTTIVLILQVRKWSWSRLPFQWTQGLNLSIRIPNSMLVTRGRRYSRDDSKDDTEGEAEQKRGQFELAEGKKTAHRLPWERQSSVCHTSQLVQNYIWTCMYAKTGKCKHFLTLGWPQHIFKKPFVD